MSSLFLRFYYRILDAINMLHMQRIDGRQTIDYGQIAKLNIPLFDGLCCGELDKMLHCLDARIAVYDKGAYLLMEGDALCNIGVILEGQAAVYKTDVLGNRVLFSFINPPQLFAEALLCAGTYESPVSVEAVSNTKALLIPFHRIIKSCGKCCVYHHRLIRNMLKIVAQKAISLTKKLDHVSHKTTRHKLASYLLYEASRGGRDRFSISFDRQALADYLCVNRSALSRELSRISGEGIISYHRSSFFIRDKQRLKQILQNER